MYTTVTESSGAIAAAARLADGSTTAAPQGWSAAAIAARLPRLVEQVMSEAGVVEPAVCARAVDQANGDVSRAVSLVRAWSACLPRLAHHRVHVDDLEVERRVTPAFREPDGGQYLGASLDYAPRLLRLDDAVEVSADDGTGPDGPLPTLPRAATALDAEGLVAPVAPATAHDRTRIATDPGAGRGAFLQLLARAETGALTAIAYTAVRGTGDDADPTVLELRAGRLPVALPHPLTGRPVRVGGVAATVVEVALYRVDRSDGDGDRADARFTLGVGATVGQLERRAIAAALLDARVARAAADPPGTAHPPADDEEWLVLALDGQEATGFVEHLKLAHHVTFTSDVERVRSVAP
jgi:alpha-D-ribose 1-methylphosphonate 5-triphosphate synthase subunit PhnI